MCYNGLNNMFFPLCQINDNHSVTSPSHTKKTKSDNYSKHHKNTLIDNKALSLFKTFFRADGPATPENEKNL